LFQAFVHAHHAAIGGGLQHGHDLLGFLRADDLAHGGCCQQHFRRQHASRIAHHGQQLLAHDGLDALRQLHAYLFLLVRGENVNDAVHGLRSVRRVQRGQHEVAGFRRHF
jgi:hypothetical protein